MMTTPQLNARLLVALGLSAETAQIVIEEIDRLNGEAAKLRSEVICLKQDLADAQRSNASLQTKVDHISDHWVARTIFERWSPVIEFMASQPDAIDSESLPDLCLAWLKERDALKTQLAAYQAHEITPPWQTCERCTSKYSCRKDETCHCPPSSHTGGVTAQD